MGIIVTIVVMSLFSLAAADPPSQQDYGLCSQVYIMHQYCTSQLSPTSTALGQRPVSQPRTGKAGPRGPSGIVNYTAINEKIAEKFSDWEEKMEEKFMTLKNIAVKEVKVMKLSIENKTEGYETDMQENFNRWKNSAESEMDEMKLTLTRKENDIQDRIEGKFTRWRMQTDSVMRRIEAEITNKTNEWEGLKERLDEQKTSLDLEMNRMKIDTANETRDFAARLQENFTIWQNSTDLKIQEIIADLANKEIEFRSTAAPLLPASCEDAGRSNGVVNILREGKMYEVYCDMSTDGGNWIVFQRRLDGSVDFYRTWEEYASGFGNKNGEFWLGLEAIHQLTQDGEYELRVDLTDRDGDTAYAKYRTFSIGGKSDGYRLTVGGYSGTAGDSLNYHNGQRFTTKDKDLDTWSSSNCATTSYGAWWYGYCAHSNLNGRYSDTAAGGYRGIWWYYWKNGKYLLKATEMKFRKK